MPDLIPDAPPVVAELHRGDTITVKAESLSGEGTSVGRFGGIVCFIGDAVPGDVALVRLFKIKKQYLAGKAVQILTPSPLRTEPKCVHFGVCGGCRWQNLSYEDQLSFKRRRVADVFERISGIDGIDVRPVIGCPDPYHYRNKMDYTFSNDRWLTQEEFAQTGERSRIARAGDASPGTLRQDPGPDPMPAPVAVG